MSQERFLYSVYPKKIIKNLPNGPVIRTNKSLSLTKEEVKLCLPYGNVYRRFANEHRNEKVTNINVDRLHHAKFMDEKEYQKYLDSLVDDQRGTTIVSSVEVQPIAEENASNETETVVEEPEQVSVEDTSEEVNEEFVENDEVEDNLEDEEEIPEEEAVEEKEVVYSNGYKKNYGGKNKHRK